MRRNEDRKHKTRWNRLGTIAGAIGIAFLVLMATVPAVEAKTEYTYYGNPAVRYNPYEIPSSIKMYVWYVEYDLLQTPAYGYGARVYLTDYGIQNLKNGGTPLAYVTSYIMSNPEWYQDRSATSVGTEIWYHANRGFTDVNIQYHYEDLDLWEYLIYGKI